MATTTVGAGTMRRLSHLRTEGAPVLTVYIDLDEERRRDAAALEAEITRLMAHAGAARDDADAVLGVVRSRAEPGWHARALAVFSCSESGVLESIALPAHVQTAAIIDSVAWLDPLTALLTTENWGVAVISRDHARLFRGGPRSLVEFAAIDAAADSPDGDGRAPARRFVREADDPVAMHVQHACACMLRAHQRAAFDHLVVVTGNELWTVVEPALPTELADRLAGRVALGLEHSSAADIAAAVTPVVRRAERRAEQALITRIDDGIPAGDAVAGVAAVLSALEQERVGTLVVAHGERLRAAVCPHCHRLSDYGNGDCPLDGAMLRPVDATSHATAVAAEQSVAVVVLDHEAPALRQRGGIAALLRW